VNLKLDLKIYEIVRFPVVCALLLDIHFLSRFRMSAFFSLSLSSLLSEDYFSHTNPFSMPPKIQQSKAAKAAAAMAGSKKSKKKWSKGKVKDKAQHAVILEQDKYDRIMKEVPTYRYVSVSVLVDRLKIGGSMARVALRQLENDGVIKPVLLHSKQQIYTRATASE